MPHQAKGKSPRSGALDQAWVQGDQIPVPDAVEQNSESVWALWNATVEKHEARFADTAPASQLNSEPALDPRYAPTQPAALAAQSAPATNAATKPKQRKLLSVDQVLVETRRNNRVCPKPQYWQHVYDRIPSDPQGARPPPPLLGAAWAVTPPLSKRMCLRDQVEWADAHGCLDAIFALLKDVPEDQWHHMGE